MRSVFLINFGLGRNVDSESKNKIGSVVDHIVVVRRISATLRARRGRQGHGAARGRTGGLRAAVTRRMATRKNSCGRCSWPEWGRSWAVIIFIYSFFGLCY